MSGQTHSQSNLESDGGAGELAATAELSKSERTRQTILTYAIEHFGRNGFRATSVSDISRSAGVSGSLAYAYFKDKEALFVAAVNQDAADVIQEGLAEALDEQGFQPLEMSAFHALLDAMDRHPLAKRILAGAESFATHLLLELDIIDLVAAGNAHRLAQGREMGLIRPEIDPEVAARAGVHLWIMALMGAAQFGRAKAAEEFQAVQMIFNMGLYVDPDATRMPSGDDNQL